MKKVIFSFILLSLAFFGCQKSEKTSDCARLENKTWRLKSVNGNALADDLEATALFENGAITGRTSCNFYNGAYALENCKLAIDSEIIRTKIWCSPAQNEIETMLVAALPACEKFEIVDDKLRLDCGTNGLLIFE